MKCGSCQSDNPDQMRFCGNCGQPLAPPPARVPASSVPLSGSLAERRQVTVLFCDLVGSTRLSDLLDPEDLRAIVRAYQSQVSDVVERYEGHIAQYQGDGVLVYFGYPRALEDAARRAVLAAREIVVAVEQQSAALERERSIKIAVRVGIHTGEGVTGALGGSQRNERLLIGSTPVIASKVQSVAKPNEIAISHTTRQLVEPYFELVELPRGLPGGTDVYRIVAERARDGRLSAVRSLGKLIGRSADVERLVTLFDESREGRGQAVLISGEAGLGKSRLLHALEARVPTAFSVLGGQCSLYAQNTALFPLIEPFERIFGIHGETGIEERKEAVEASLEAFELANDTTRARIASFFGLPAPEGYTPPPLTPQKQLDALFETLLEILLGRAKREPVVVSIEDLHWADPTTLRFLDQLSGALASARIIMVCTSRPGFHASWPEGAHVTMIDLRRLTRDDVMEIITDRTDGKHLPPAIVDQIVQRADGIPLFAEELTRAVLESGMVVSDGGKYTLARPLETPEVPATLRDSLMARLDRFGPAKEVAQIASAIGRFVPWPLLKEVSAIDEERLRTQLARLVEAEIMTRDVVGEAETFVFRHALIHDVAHDSMLRARRREVHGRIARTIVDSFPSLADEQPELVARHFEEAALDFDATTHLLRGGMRAMGRGAPNEAIAQLNRGVELLSDKPENGERWERELQLRAVLAGALMSTRGYAAPETEEDLIRARELCSLLGDPPEVFMVLWGLWGMYTARGDARESERYASEIMKFVEPDTKPEVELPARFAYASMLMYTARYDASLEEHKRIAALYDPKDHGYYVQTFGIDVGIYGICNLMLVELLTGHFDKAREAMTLARKYAEKHGDPLSGANVEGFEVVLQFYQRKPDRILEASTHGLKISNEYGYDLWRTIAQFGHGWYRAVYEQDHGGIDEMSEGIAVWERLDERVPMSLWMSYLVEGLIAVGRHEEALSRIDRVLADSAGTMDQIFEPDLLRMKGESLLATGDSAGASEQIHRAIARAREHKTVALELRAAVSLAELCAQRGDLSAAKETLETAFSKVEGAEDVPEHKRAKAFLDQLTATATA